MASDEHVRLQPPAMTVGELMTANPITLSSDSLAAEALTTIGTHRIDDIVVLDSEGKPTGLVDTQDFARLKLI